MRDYVLNGKIITTTEDRYEKQFKSQGYIPIEEADLNNQITNPKEKENAEALEKLEEENKKLSGQVNTLASEKEKLENEIVKLKEQVERSTSEKKLISDDKEKKKASKKEPDMNGNDEQEADAIATPSSTEE